MQMKIAHRVIQMIQVLIHLLRLQLKKRKKIQKRKMKKNDRKK